MFRWMKAAFFVALFCGGGLGLLLTAGCATLPATPGVLKTDLDANSLIFPGRYLKHSQTRTFRLFNGGFSDVTIESVAFSDKEALSLETKLKFPLVLKPGNNEGIDITVRFTAQKIGEYIGVLRFASSDASNVDNKGNFVITIRSGKVHKTPLLACSELLDFGSVGTGQSKVLDCSFQNVSGQNITLRSWKARLSNQQESPFHWKTPTLPTTIRTDATMKFQLEYKPTVYSKAPVSGEIVLQAELGKEKVDIVLKVRGQTNAGILELLPVYPVCSSHQECKTIDSRLSCEAHKATSSQRCQVEKGKTPLVVFPLISDGASLTRKVELRALAGQAISIRELRLSGSSEFVLASKHSFPFVLKPGQAEIVEIRYTKASSGRGTGELTVLSEGSSTPTASVLLEAVRRGCNLLPSVRRIKFTTPMSVQVDLINKGNEACVLNSVSIKEDKENEYSLIPVPTPGTSIPPNGKTSVLVKYRPQKFQRNNAVLEIVSNDPDEPQIKISLESWVIAPRECELTATPTALDFGTVSEKRKRYRTVIFTNKGWGDCKLTAVKALGTSPSGNNGFGLRKTMTFPVTINSGANLRMDVSFSPPDLKTLSYAGKLEVRSNDKKQPVLEVRLKGVAGLLCLDTIPHQMNFGSVKVGCNSETRTLTIYNLYTKGCPQSVNVTGGALSSTSNKAFKITSMPTVPRNLRQGQSLNVTMRYQPTVLGTQVGTFRVTHDFGGQGALEIPLMGEAVNSNQQQDVFKQVSRPKADILFIVDDSSSMGNEQAELAKNFKSFIQWATRLNFDYHIGVTTTDATGTRFPPGCLRGSVKYITPNTPNGEKTFEVNVKVGTSGPGLEQGLEGGYRAFLPAVLNNPNCNKGFYRQDASLSLIFVSDEPDGSPQPVQFYVNFFRSLKGPRNVDQIRASAVVGPPPQGCRHPTAGQAGSGPRYWDVAKQLRGVQESICNVSWASVLSNLGSVSFGFRQDFFLSRVADKSTIVVKINGRTIKQSSTDGWTYNASNNSLSFTKSSIPAPGATITVDYKVLCTP